MSEVYCGPAPTLDSWIGAWNFDIPALLLCTAIVALYVIIRPGDRKLTLSCSVVLIALLFLSPFCALTAALFSARAAHHILLIAGVAPLLAMVFTASASSTTLSVPPEPQRSSGWKAGLRFVRNCSSIGRVATLQAAVFWFWHAPTVYAVAVTHPVAYWTMQLTLLGSAFWLWCRVFDQTESTGGALLALFGTTVQMGLLGALLTFASSPLYEPHFLTTIPFGLTPIQDQQLAGLIMWVPAALPYLAAALWRVRPLLDSSARRTPWSG